MGCAYEYVLQEHLPNWRGHTEHINQISVQFSSDVIDLTFSMTYCFATKVPSTRDSTGALLFSVGHH